MNPKPAREGVYRPLLDKSFVNVLSHWLAEEFPHLGGPKVRELFVSEIVRLIEAHYIPAQRLQPGQTIWYAVDKTDLPHDGRSMAETRLIPVTLTLVAREDIEALMKGLPIRELRRRVAVRLHREADAQGGVSAETDTALLLCQSHSSISALLRAYEQDHECVIPRRGTVHDLGRSVSHKATIAKKAVLEAKQAPEVAWETDHTLFSTERYLVALMRVYISLKRHHMTVEETAFATNMSVSLVKEYAALIDELNLNDDSLPSIMTELERRAAIRGSQSSAPDSASGD